MVVGRVVVGRCGSANRRFLSSSRAVSWCGVVLLCLILVARRCCVLGKWSSLSLPRWLSDSSQSCLVVKLLFVCALVGQQVRVRSGGRASSCAIKRRGGPHLFRNMAMLGFVRVRGEPPCELKPAQTSLVRPICCDAPCSGQLRRHGNMRFASRFSWPRHAPHERTCRGPRHPRRSACPRRAARRFPPLRQRRPRQCTRPNPGRLAMAYL